jgi:hypothetical protein
MWPFRRRPEPAPQPATIDVMATLGEAFAKSFAAQIDGNAKVAQIFGAFIEQMGALSIRQAARQLGQRSAATRKRDGKGKFQPKAKNTSCPLCDDPMTRNVSIEMIRAHRSHEAGMASDIVSSDSSSSSPGAPDIPPEIGN